MMEIFYIILSVVNVAKSIKLELILNSIPQSLSQKAQRWEEMMTDYTKVEVKSPSLEMAAGSSRGVFIEINDFMPILIEGYDVTIYPGFSKVNLKAA